MGTASISCKYDYLYKINNSYSTFSDKSGNAITIEILPSSDISLLLSPPQIPDAKWQQYLKFNVLIKNESSSVIDNITIKLNTSENLTYVSGTLINNDTGIYYPCVDWLDTFSTAESIEPGKTLNLSYYLKPVPDINEKCYVKNPLAVNNTIGDFSKDTNYSYINLCEQKLVITQDISGSVLFIENRGTVESESFTYKYVPPSNLIFSGASLSGTPFTDIVSSKLGKNYLFKIGPLPSSTPENKKILTLTFS